MENELTHRSSNPYPVMRNTMDESLEKEQPSVDVEKTVKTSTDSTEEENKKKEHIAATSQSKEAARKAWEAENKKREEKGEKITDEEREVQRQLIEKGMPPVGGGSGDGGYFENFPISKFDNPQLKSFAEEIRRLGQNNQITEERLQEITQAVNDMALLGSIREEVSQEFVEEISRVRVARDTNQPYESGEADMGENVSGGDENGSTFGVNLHLFEGSQLEGIARQMDRLDKAGQRPTQQMLGQWVNQATQLLANGEITPELHRQFSAELNAFMNTPAADQAAGRERGRNNTPQSIQEVCRWIINAEGDEWGPGGVNELMDEEGHFNQASFVKWVRERMLHFQDLDPNNPNINLLGSIGVETDFRTIGLITMINNKKQYFKDDLKTDENGRNVVYSELADDIINEVYLFNTSRNHDASYRFGMWSDEDLPKLLGQLHQKSDFTNADQLKKILMLSADYGSGDTKVGDAIRKAYEVYYYMSDFEKLQEILGPDSAFFTRKGFEDAYRLSQGGTADAPIPDNYKVLFDKLFDANGKAKPGEFISYVNLFNETGKLQSTVSLVREAVRLSVSGLAGLENGLNRAGRERIIGRKNLEYAEMWAYTMSRWTGAGARNDTGAIGYDAQTKTMRFQQYRIRQSRGERAGAFGNEYDIPVIKDLTLDFFNGIFVEKPEGEDKDLTPFEIMQQLDEVDKRTDLTDEQKLEMKKPIYDRLKFKQYTQLDYASNHLGRAWGIFHKMMSADEIQLDQIVKYEPFRGLVFDRGKFEEQVKEGFIKPIRYAFKTYSNIDYSKTMRVQDLKASRNAGRPIYKDVTMAEAMFGPMVLRDFYKDGKNEVDPEKLKGDEARTKLYKNVTRAILAAHIKAHRERFSGYSKMTEGQMEKFYEALLSIRAVDIEDDEETMKKSEHFYSEEDIKWMRKYSKTGKFRLFMTDVAPSVAQGVAGGFFKGAKDFFDDIFK